MLIRFRARCGFALLSKRVAVTLVPPTNSVYFYLRPQTDGQRILRVLDDRERPLVVQTDWPKDSYRFRLCRRPDYPATTTTRRKETSPQLPSGGSSTNAGSPTLSAARELTAKDMYVSVATPFGGKFQSVKTEIDEDTTARQVLEQVKKKIEVDCMVVSPFSRLL